MRSVVNTACLSDEELASLAVLNPHVEACDTCRSIWLHAREPDASSWTVGRYQVRGTLGAGGLGVVLLGWDPVLQREVAIKFPAAQGGLLLREAQSLAAIRHRNVVAVHDFGEVDGDVYFTMERVEGVPFDTWWLGASTAERLRALIDVAAGLGAIHAAGLVHCDIKPSNIVVTRAGDPVIVDLGLATSSGEAQTGGTPGYRAPELEQGAAASVASDEYAFWCVVRQCMSAVKLSGLDALLARGTSADPKERFGSLAACSAALRKVTKSRRGLVVAIALAGVAAAAVTVMLVRGNADTCERELPAWSRDAVTKQLANRPDVLARVVDFVQRERKAGQALLAKTCNASDAAALRTRWCVISSWRFIDGHLRAIANNRDIPRSLDEMPSGVPAERCSGVSASPPAVDANATPASRKLLGEMLGAETLPPNDKLAKLTALESAVKTADNAGLTAAWSLELADAQKYSGKERDAIANALVAVDVATRNGDDLVLARARLMVYVLRDVPDRAGTVRDAEVEAIVVRVGSPGLLATFQNAAGQRAIALDDLPRAKELLERAVATHAALELAPSSQRGSAEQNLAVVYQFTDKRDDAQTHLDRAVEVFTSRYGATHELTAGAKLAAAHNQLYRGKIEEGARLLDALASELVAAKRDHTTLGAHVAFARCQAAMASAKDALTRCTEALASTRAVFGAEHVECVPPLLAVAQLTMAKSVRDALPFLEKAIAISEKQANNPTDLPYARGLYALALKVTGRASDGLAIAKLAVGDLERLGQKELVATLRAQFPTL